MKFTAVLNSLDGAEELRVKHDSEVGSVSEGCELGKIWARELLSQGGAELMADIKAHFKKPRILSTKVLSPDLENLVRKTGAIISRETLLELRLRVALKICAKVSPIMW